MLPFGISKFSEKACRNNINHIIITFVKRILTDSERGSLRANVNVNANANANANVDVNADTDAYGQTSMGNAGNGFASRILERDAFVIHESYVSMGVLRFGELFLCHKSVSNKYSKILGILHLLFIALRLLNS